MLEYGTHLFQDAIEINWVTTPHAHLVLLQDIERTSVPGGVWRQ